MNTRIDVYDIAKGIGIMLVYIGHAHINHNGALFCWIYSFHMPLFFLISGMLFKDKCIKGGFVYYSLKKIVNLMIPYFLFSFVYLLWTFHSQGNVLDVILHGWGRIPLWFIPVLFMIEEMHFIILQRRTILKVLVMFVLVLLFLYKITYNQYLPYSISEIPWFYLCFLTGYLINKHLKNLTLILVGGKKADCLLLSLVLFVLGGALLFFVILPYNNNYRQQDNDILSYIYRYAVGVNGSLAMLFLSRGLSDLPIANIFKWLGKKSMIILCSHWLPFNILYYKTYIWECHVATLIIILATIYIFNLTIAKYNLILLRRINDRYSR